MEKVFLTYIGSDERTHISVGPEPTTLCGETSIVSALQVEMVTDIIRDLDREPCEECLNTWNEKSVSPRPVKKCHRCDNPYDRENMHQITHITDEEVIVCDPCHTDLLESDESPVER